MEETIFSDFFIVASLELSGSRVNGEIIELSPYTPCASPSANPTISAERIKPAMLNLADRSSCSISTSSEATWQLAMECLHECSKSHQNCKVLGDLKTALPTRLVNVGDPNWPYVAITATDGVEGQYLALSYCWGGKGDFKLTTATLNSLRSGVPMESLPKTIQDAVQITRKLGFRWLWVDSLCIIQDSLADWIRESAAMVKVYQNCFLTIAALGSPESGGGIFGQRDPLMNKGCWMYQRPDGRAFYAHSSQLLHSYFEARYEASPLHTRGWVMQERLLSPRTLNFGTSFIWECRERLFDEFGTGIQLGSPTFKGEFMTIDPPDVDFYHFWNEAVYRYSKSGLTAKADRLIAITGVIRAIEKRTEWKNVAGLWEQAMIHQLLWQTIGGKSKPVSGISAPTWSWAATDSHVSYIADVLPLKLTFIANVEEIKYTSTESGSIEQPLGTTIHISCPLKTAEQPVPLNEDDYRVALVGWPESSVLNFAPDFSPIPSGPYYFAPLMLNGYGTVCGLLLVMSAAFPGKYERIGFAQTPHKESGADHSALIDFTERKFIMLV